MKKVIRGFQKYLTENRKALQRHLDKAVENDCGWDEKVVRQRISDLFIVRYRLEQLLSKAGYEDLCVLSAFNEKTRKEIENL